MGLPSDPAILMEYTNQVKLNRKPAKVFKSIYNTRINKRVREVGKRRARRIVASSVLPRHDAAHGTTALKISPKVRFYNQNSGPVPSEVFRMDFIQAMRNLDGTSLDPSQYWMITDSWKTEWDKAIQVPASCKSSAMPKFIQIPTHRTTFSMGKPRFRLPKEYINESESCNYSSFEYNMDNLDQAWLRAARDSGLVSVAINQDVLEKTIQFLEVQCSRKLISSIGTENDESRKCDICLDPVVEDGNEMVFCDSCDICVHQGCYGIRVVPQGSWFCKPCERGVHQPTCMLCPHTGGAFSSVRNSHEWVHTLCAWWVPEVKIENVEDMDGVVIGHIPKERKNLTCSLCQQRIGACVQCSSKKCTVAYHVTCAVQNHLRTETSINDGKVIYTSYCPKHHRPATYKETDRPEGYCTSRHQTNSRCFSRVAKPQDLVSRFKVSRNDATRLYSYWVLKRRSREGKPLLSALERTPARELTSSLGLHHLPVNEDLVSFRIDLEKVRNLCFLTRKREKLKKKLCETAREIFSLACRHTILAEVTNGELGQAKCSWYAVDGTSAEVPGVTEAACGADRKHCSTEPRRPPRSRQQRSYNATVTIAPPPLHRPRRLRKRLVEEPVSSSLGLVMSSLDEVLCSNSNSYQKHR